MGLGIPSHLRMCLGAREIVQRIKCFTITCPIPVQSPMIPGSELWVQNQAYKHWTLLVVTPKPKSREILFIGEQGTCPAVFRVTPGSALWNPYWLCGRSYQDSNLGQLLARQIISLLYYNSNLKKNLFDIKANVSRFAERTSIQSTVKN